jgi:hypothetical protein
MRLMVALRFVSSLVTYLGPEQAGNMFSALHNGTKVTCVTNVGGGGEKEKLPETC